MTNIVAKDEKVKNLSSRISDDLEQYKFNHHGLIKTLLEHTAEITDNGIDIVDPTNPFIMLLSSTCITAAGAATESLGHLREMYPNLAHTHDEIYNHMSDNDYLNTFSTPSTGIVTFVINHDALFNAGEITDNGKFKKITIPRDTTIKVSETTFTLQYPIDVSLTIDENTGQSLGIIEVTYDTSIVSPLQGLYSKLIEHTVQRDPTNNVWIAFRVPVRQFKIQSNNFQVITDATFSKEVFLEDKFYTARAYRLDSGTETWMEVKVTHSDTVYDLAVPTVRLKVIDNRVIINVPNVYITSGALTGTIRLDIYDTKGKIYLAMKDTPIADWIVNMDPIDGIRDSNKYTVAASSIDIFVKSDDIVNGGTDSKTLEELRSDVVSNSLGAKQLPTTEKQLSSSVSDLGYSMVKAYDIVTDRTFSVSKNLPNVTEEVHENKPTLSTHKLVNTEEELLATGSVYSVGDALVMEAETLLIVENDILRVMTVAEVNSLNGLTKFEKITALSTVQHYYTPYEVILDRSGSSFSTRMYNVSTPIINGLNFISSNQTINIIVNTGNYNVSKTDTGYRLALSTISNDEYKSYTNTLLKAQIRIKTDTAGNYGYLNSSSVITLDTNERYFIFDIDSNFFIDKNDRLTVSGMTTTVSDPTILLLENIDVFYILDDPTATVEIYDANNDIDINGYNNPQALTKETLTVNFIDNLEYLWSKSYFTYNENKYLKSAIDVPLTYDRKVFETNENNGYIFTIDTNVNPAAIVYNTLHLAGDPVLDVNDDPVYKYLAGDTIIDEDSNPVIDTVSGVELNVDILLIEAEYIVSDTVEQASRNLLYTAIITGWVLNELSGINDKLLELTNVYLSPLKTSGTVKVRLGNDTLTSIPTALSPKITVFVNESTYNDTDLLSFIEKQVVRALEQNISGNVVNMTTVKNNILSELGTSGLGLKITNLGDISDGDVVILEDKNTRLKLKKKLEITSDGFLSVGYETTVVFSVI